MNPQVTDPNYKPITFSEQEIKDRYERKRQKEEHRYRSLKALTHEAFLTELPTQGVI